MQTDAAPLITVSMQPVPSESPAPAVPRAAPARHAARLPRGGAGRGQDLRHAQRGPPPQGARHRRGRGLRRDPRPGPHRRADRRPRGRAPPGPHLPRRRPRGDGPRRRPRPATRRGPGRRVGAHQRARVEARQALGGRRRAARRRHRRDLHGQHPAPRVDQRRGRAHHGRASSARPCPTRSSGPPIRSSWST